MGWLGPVPLGGSRFSRHRKTPLPPAKCYQRKSQRDGTAVTPQEFGSDSVARLRARQAWAAASAASTQKNVKLEEATKIYRCDHRLFIAAVTDRQKSLPKKRT